MTDDYIDTREGITLTPEEAARAAWARAILDEEKGNMMTDYIDTRDGWREVDVSNVREPWVCLSTGSGPARYWVHEEPEPLPGPTDPGWVPAGPGQAYPYGVPTLRINAGKPGIPDRWFIYKPEPEDHRDYWVSDDGQS